MLNKLYKIRFNEKEITRKGEIWRVLCKYFFARYIKEDSSLLDIGCGFGEFINNVKCIDKYAIDLNVDAKDFLNAEVKFYQRPATDLSFLENDKIDTVFASNILEHLETKDQLFQCLLEIKRVLKRGGRLIIMGPNMRYVYKEYWDFIDHRLPLSSKSIVEILGMLDYSIERVIDRFLPYTTKSRIPKSPFLIRLYLSLPFAWNIFGKQMLVVAKKS